jgi:hypothetical protein
VGGGNKDIRKKKEKQLRKEMRKERRTDKEIINNKMNVKYTSCMKRLEETKEETEGVERATEIERDGKGSKEREKRLIMW